eukprot:scaffold987_cov138-Isochrysis_galbana.AAC.2
MPHTTRNIGEMSQRYGEHGAHRHGSEGKSGALIICGEAMPATATRLVCAIGWASSSMAHGREPNSVCSQEIKTTTDTAHTTTNNKNGRGHPMKRPLQGKRNQGGAP